MKTFLLLAVTYASLSAAPVGLFTQITNTVQTKGEGRGVWLSVRRGDALYNDFLVQSNSEGSAEILFFDGVSQALLQPQTAIKIKVADDDFKGAPTFLLKQGTLICRTQGGKDTSLQVKTVTTGVSAGLAHFAVTVDQEGATLINVLEGRVLVSNPKLEAEIPATTGDAVYSTARELVSGKTDPARLAELLAAGNAGIVRGNRKIVLTFSDENKNKKKLEILLKQR